MHNITNDGERDVSECSSPCFGNVNQTCGTDFRIAVYDCKLYFTLRISFRSEKLLYLQYNGKGTDFHKKRFLLLNLVLYWKQLLQHQLFLKGSQLVPYLGLFILRGKRNGILSFLTDNWLSRNEMWCAVDNQNYGTCSIMCKRTLTLKWPRGRGVRRDPRFVFRAFYFFRFRFFSPLFFLIV